MGEKIRKEQKRLREHSDFDANPIPGEAETGGKLGGNVPDCGVVPGRQATSSGISAEGFVSRRKMPAS